jgi:preprotein translocase subunit SecD
MKKCLVLLAALCCLCLTSCKLAKVNAGEEGVFVMKPWFFGHGGVDYNPISAGSSWMVFTTKCVTFSVIPIQYNEDFSDIMSSDNTPVNLTAHALIKIEKSKTPLLLDKFGENWYENDIQKDFCNEVRNEISKWPMMQLTCKREIYDSMSNKIENILRKKIQKDGIPIELIKVIIDKASPTKEVMEEYNHTAAQIQAKQTQQAAAQMQITRKDAETKRAEADDAYRVKMGLNPDQYIKLRQLEIEKEKVDMVRNKGNVSITMLMGNGALPMYNVR